MQRVCHFRIARPKIKPNLIHVPTKYILKEASVNYNSNTSTQKAFRHLIAYLIISTYLLLMLSAGNLFYSAMQPTDGDAMVDLLSTGAFNSHNARATSIFMGIAGDILSWALPFMSTFALLMVTISLVSFVIVVLIPDVCKDIHEAHENRYSSGSKVSDLFNYAKSNGIKEFIMSILPDFYAIAFKGMNDNGGEITFKDFFRNIPKYMAVFAVCILINNRAMLDGLMAGAKFGTYLFERVVYDVDLVESFNRVIDEGSDYKPNIWNTKTHEGANKLRVYNKIYDKLKSRLPEDDRSTDAKAILGTKVSALVDSDIFADVGWDKEVMSVSVNYSPYVQASGVQGVYTVPVQEFIPSDTQGALDIKIYTEDRTKNVGTYAVTTYNTAWVGGTSGSIPTGFNLMQVEEMKINDLSTVSDFKGSFNVTIQYVDAQGRQQAETTQVQVDGGGNVPIKFNNSSISASNVSSLKIVPAGSITYKVHTVNGNETTKDLNLKSSIIWKNEAFSPKTQ